MKILKIVTMAGMVAALLVAAGFMSVTAGRVAAGTEPQDQFDATTFYKAKCVACHGQKAEKKFDSNLPDEQLIDAVMKGKKPEKPPNMPAYADKGVSAEQAKTLVEHMKLLKSAP